RIEMKFKLLTIDISHEYDVVLARQRARQVAAALRFDLQEQTRIATAVSEIARNAFQYAGRGRAEFELCDDTRKRFQVTVRDQGKGIADVDRIVDGKYVSQTGMGLGLVGAKRLMDEFEIETSSAGTRVTLGRNIAPTFQRLSQGELDNLLKKVEQRSPENVYEELQQQNK